MEEVLQVNKMNAKTKEDIRKNGIYIQSWNKLDCLQVGGREQFECPRNMPGYVRET
jgi:hypothetical protein